MMQLVQSSPAPAATYDRAKVSELVRRRREFAEADLIAADVIEALAAIGEPATSDEVAEIVDATCSQTRNALSYLTYVGQVQCKGTLPRRGTPYVPARFSLVIP